MMWFIRWGAQMCQGLGLGSALVGTGLSPFTTPHYPWMFAADALVSLAGSITLIYLGPEHSDLRMNRIMQRTAELEREAGLVFEGDMLADGYRYGEHPVREFTKPFSPPKKKYKSWNATPAPKKKPVPGQWHDLDIRAAKRRAAATANTLSQNFDRAEQESLKSTRRALQDCHHVWSPIEHTCVKCGASVPSTIVREETVLARDQLGQIDRVEEALRALHGKWPNS